MPAPHTARPSDDLDYGLEDELAHLEVTSSHQDGLARFPSRLQAITWSPSKSIFIVEGFPYDPRVKTIQMPDGRVVHGIVNRGRYPCLGTSQPEEMLENGRYAAFTLAAGRFVHPYLLEGGDCQAPERSRCNSNYPYYVICGYDTTIVSSYVEEGWMGTTGCDGPLPHTWPANRRFVGARSWEDAVDKLRYDPKFEASPHSEYRPPGFYVQQFVKHLLPPIAGHLDEWNQAFDPDHPTPPSKHRDPKSPSRQLQVDLLHNGLCRPPLLCSLLHPWPRTCHTWMES